jgi:hypothetical protein
MALLEAAYRVGYDGNGRDGACGYFRWVATRDPDFFYDLWSRLLELQVYEAAKRAEAPCITNELDDQMPKRSVRRKQPRSFTLPREGPNAEVQGLMHLSIERPKAFGKLFSAAFLTPPQNWRALARKHGLLLPSEADFPSRVRRSPGWPYSR